MRIEAIFCPACRHKLRISEDLLGTEVQCPECKAQFVAPPPPPGAVASDADREVLPAQGPVGGPVDDYGRTDEPQPDSGRKVVPPAIGILVGAAGHLLLNALAAIQALVMPEQMREKVKAMLPGVQLPVDVVQVSLVAGLAFLALSLVQAICGLAMLTRRSYTLALCGAALSIANCNQLCCLISLPVGIWALVVLMTPDVRASFPR